MMGRLGNLPATGPIGPKPMKLKIPINKGAAMRAPPIAATATLARDVQTRCNRH